MNCLRKTHKVEFYPIADNFTQALLVMLVTNITSGKKYFSNKSGKHLWIDSFYCKIPEGERRQEEQERGFEIVGTSAPDRTLDEVQRRAF